MRPTLLKITAIGPYANTETIDFERLRDKKLFLINGPTGSGKTTILDSITLALYGEASGNERENSEIRSQWADENITASVEFTFELGEKKYRILRKPAQTMNKKRGTGTTTKNTEGELWEISDNGEEKLIEKKSSSVTQKIIELIGLDASQFRQVIILPQGEFRKVLTAKSNERETILEKLFKTTLYKKVTENIGKLKNESKKSLTEKETELKTILSTHNISDIDQLHNELKKIAKETENLKQEETTLSKNRKQIEKIINSERTVFDLYENLDNKKSKLATIQSQENHYKEIEIKITQGKKSLKYSDMLNRIKKLQKEITQLESHITNSQKDSMETERRIKKIEDKKIILAKSSEELKSKIVRKERLKEQLPQFEQLKKIEQELMAFYEHTGYQGRS